MDRAANAPVLFDAAQAGSFALDAAPAPWIDLGWCSAFTRTSATRVEPLRTGAPAVVQTQVRTEIEATVSLRFESWGKLQMALAAGSQQMNLLATAAGATANGSGGAAAAAIPLLAGSTAISLNIGAAAASFNVGDLIAVDVDYAGQLGFVGSGISGACVASATAVNGDANYVRRISLNVARVTGIAAGALQLGAPLPAGIPSPSMQVSRLAGFVDREGGGWFQEWSALFVMDGEQGDRVIYHYPRLQSMQSAAESFETLAAPFERVRLAGAFRALPVKDANDGETVLCFRSYLPAAMRAI
ncbi:MAG: hypothetical protein J0G35_00710 [Acidobacteriales bacterium]|nr:hypothetical protein [Terriglobales bacterium]